MATKPKRMSAKVLHALVLRTFGRTRLTQDSPIVPDVWLRYIRVAEKIAHARIAEDRSAEAAARKTAVDLLLTPWFDSTPGAIAKELRRRVSKPQGEGPADDLRRAAVMQSAGYVVVGLRFEQMIAHVLPMTGWTLRPAMRRDAAEFAARWLTRVKDTDDRIRAMTNGMSGGLGYLRFVVLVGFIRAVMEADTAARLEALRGVACRLGGIVDPAEDEDEDEDNDDGLRRPAALAGAADVAPLVQSYFDLVGNPVARQSPARGQRAASSGTAAERDPDAGDAGAPGNANPDGAVIFNVTLNRVATQSMFEARRTVKADAVANVFRLATRGLTVAVIDGGIDKLHEAFDLIDPNAAPRTRRRAADAKSRILRTYDFTLLRKLAAAATIGAMPKLDARGKLDAEGMDLTDAEAARALKLLKANSTAFNDACAHLQIRGEKAREIDWDIVEPLIRIGHDRKEYVSPGTTHGTHVAGILAANYASTDLEEPLVGMCPDLCLYDLRVFDAEGLGDEFSILCAVEFVGWLNRNRSQPMIHAVNLSLALRHNVDSFACGRTPICEVCNHLVANGTVVVAAAGNTGFDTSIGLETIGQGYRSISITDPGNAENVITVGSTHRRDPHAYGVSYFSSRGPTGDGRPKPDLLAPGEKIVSTIRNGDDDGVELMDGTSMAAPLVTGAAVMLMARYPELIGRPQTIKEILMRSATDLGRTRDFQGAGLLDVLRALQAY